MEYHILKTLNPHFTAVLEKRKTFEIRKNDRDFKVGDYLFLGEFILDTGVFTGRMVEVQVTYIFEPDGKVGGLEEGYVIIAFQYLGSGYLPDLEGKSKVDKLALKNAGGFRLRYNTSEEFRFSKETSHAIVAECMRLQDFARCAKNGPTFEVCEDTRDAACMHLVWLNNLLTDNVRYPCNAVVSSIIERISKAVDTILNDREHIDWSEIFFICASLSRELFQHV